MLSGIRLSPSAVLSGSLGTVGLSIRVWSFRTQRKVLECGNQSYCRGYTGRNPPESSVFETAVIIQILYEKTFFVFLQHIEAGNNGAPYVVFFYVKHQKSRGKVGKMCLIL